MLHRSILPLAFAFALLSSLVAYGAPAPTTAPASAASAAPTTQGSLQTPDDAYRATFYWLSKGRQADAEDVLAEAIQLYDHDPRLLFFAAACTRSRFDVEAAAPMFVNVTKAAPKSVYSTAAKLMLVLDMRYGDTSKMFDLLQQFTSRHMDDPLLVWMAAVQCRSLNRNQEGIIYFEHLVKQLDPGPVLVHQTYANLLDEVGRYADALPHRRLAVKLEPKSWSYDGLGNTLTNLRRFDEADVAFKNAITFSPSDGHIWRNWALSMRKRGDDAGAVEKYKLGTRCDPESVNLWNDWGDLEYRLVHPRAALEKYRKSIALAPKSPYAYRQAARVYDQMGDRKNATEMRAKLAELAIGTTASTSP